MTGVREVVATEVAVAAAAVRAAVGAAGADPGRRGLGLCQEMGRTIAGFRGDRDFMVTREGIVAKVFVGSSPK